MTMVKDWFSVDKKGLAKLLERRGKEFVLYELIQNSWDTNAPNVIVSLTASTDNPGYANLVVTDDNPEGWKDLTHAWTLYAESEKKSDVKKRGRFNLGEKLVLALCREAEIHTTKRSVRFDSRGRHVLGGSRTEGSSFRALIKMTKKEMEEAEQAVMRLICPIGVRTLMNGKELEARVPKRQIEVTLPTEVADAEGILRPSARKTIVEVVEPKEGEVPSIYELGIPIVETGDRYHYNVMQKVPLNSDRDNVRPSYLREIRTMVLNEMYKDLTPEDASSWARNAMEGENVEKEAVEALMALRFSDKRVIADPSDPEGTKLAMSQGYEVIPPRALSKEEWANVRKFGAALPAGQVTPSPRPYRPDGEEEKILPKEKWTAGIRKVAAYAEYVAKHVLQTTITVKIVTDVSWPFAATFGRSGELTLNVGRLGYSWFDAPYWTGVDELLTHEFGHWYAADHLSEDYHKAICKVAAGLVALALHDPQKMKELRG